MYEYDPKFDFSEISKQWEAEKLGRLAVLVARLEEGVEAVLVTSGSLETEIKQLQATVLQLQTTA